MNNLPDKLGRGPLLVGLMAGAELGAVEEMIEYGENPAQEDEVGLTTLKQYLLTTGVSKSRFAGRTLPLKYSNFQQIYKKN